MSDVIIQAQSTLFNRQGFTDQRKGYFLNPTLVSLIAQAYINYFVSLQATNAEQSMLYTLLTQNPIIIGGGLTLYNIQALDPTLFPGAAEIKSIYQQDPFGTTYVTATEALYADSYAVARTAAVSGPTNVRGGTARQGFELAELDNLQSINRFREVWQNQMTMAQMVISATSLANQAEGQRRSDMLRAQQQQSATEQGKVMQMLTASEMLSRDKEANLRSMAAGSEFLGVPQMTTSEQLAGEGFQGAVNTSFGMSYWR